MSEKLNSLLNICTFIVKRVTILKAYYFTFLFLFILGFLNAQKYSVSSLELNSKYPHFGLMHVNNKNITFTSQMFDKKGRVKKVQGIPILTIYQGEISEENQIVNVAPVLIDPKQKLINITSATISPNGANLYITIRYNYRNKPAGKFNMENFHIEVGEYKPEVGWTNFKVLPFCKPKYSYAHPSISKDGKTLYFTSNLKNIKVGTKGAADIFKVSLLEHGAYSVPENLGPNVNSYGKEMFPVIANDNTLYFSSNRPGGYGRYDIYKCVMNENGEFTKAKKLPKPLNTNRDDFSLITLDGCESGYLSSKRLKGKGDDDIYYFKKK